MRVIFDTNVLLSALLSPDGVPAKLLQYWERSAFALVTCDQLIAEFREVVARPFFRARLSGSAIELLAAGLRDFSVRCNDLDPEVFSPDLKDGYLLALMSASDGDFFVTGDRELLALKRYRSTRVLTPAAFLKHLEGLKNSEFTPFVK
jgi:putative PIN family toxin of toxin-antitoxin system